MDQSSGKAAGKKPGKESDDFRCEGTLLNLPHLWSNPDRFGPGMAFGIGDADQQVIADLGPAGRDEAITSGVLNAMKALGVALYLNHRSVEESVQSDIVIKERDSLKIKVTGLEGELSKATEDHVAVIAEKDKQLASYRQRYRNAEKLGW